MSGFTFNPFTGRLEPSAIQPGDPVSSLDNDAGYVQTDDRRFADVVTVAAAVEIDWAASNVHTKTLAANATFTFANMTSGQTIVVAVTNTASDYTVIWPTVQWSGGAAPTQTIGAKTDIYTFIRVGSVTYGAVSPNHS